MMSQMHEQLTCSICLELYKDPVRLTCFHVFCKKCIMDSMDTGHRRPVCPECNAPIENDDEGSLKKDFKIAALVQTVKETPKCVEHHDDTGERKAHVICQTCCKLLCVKCVFSENHRNHDTDDLESAIAKQKDIFERKIPAVKRKLADYNKRLADTKKAHTEITRGEEESRLNFKRLIACIKANVESLQTHGDQAISNVVHELMNVCTERESELKRKVTYGEKLIKCHDEFEKDPATSFKVIKEYDESGFEFYNTCQSDFSKRVSASDVVQRYQEIGKKFVHNLVSSCLREIRNVTSDQSRQSPNGTEGRLPYSCSAPPLTYAGSSNSGTSASSAATRDGIKREVSEPFVAKHSATGEDSKLKIKFSKGMSGKRICTVTGLNKHSDQSQLSSVPSSTETDTFISDSSFASHSTTFKQTNITPETSKQAEQSGMEA
ncbi:E3 ubiquitin-protein ligase TRIM7-like isoform X1 [Mercenaria mercenaria]|uniref:E3 ubiquitin-protein ligase TRIM7-like isoform X1 n=1 Tax=Mercenaria mercenaria TaxID=6596 RepID=UPI00234FA7DF|nr:E3 ubiquitin-protein ligase TRIM7-like isoform X1 [Mercenaria mercenaria]XP_053403756.1 E3 ubiquitin-protein ligase TRIM7-like isoform X1 [Mercenaria mercenaria]